MVDEPQSKCNLCGIIQILHLPPPQAVNRKSNLITRRHVVSSCDKAEATKNRERFIPAALNSQQTMNNEWKPLWGTPLLCLYPNLLFVECWFRLFSLEVTVLQHSSFFFFLFTFFAALSCVEEAFFFFNWRQQNFMDPLHPPTNPASVECDRWVWMCDSVFSILSNYRPSCGAFQRNTNIYSKLFLFTDQSPLSPVWLLKYL